MPCCHETLHKLLPQCYSFSICPLVLRISVPFVCCNYLCCNLSEAKKMLYYMLIGHLILRFWRVELSALKYNIIHNLRSRISLEMIQSFILSLQMLHITVNKPREHRRHVIQSTTTPDVLGNRTRKDQEARDFTHSSVSYVGLAGSSSGVDFKSLGFWVFFLSLI